MKCISLWQPWASLMMIGAKKVETRGWSTNYRGPLAIHAAKHRDKDCEAYMGHPDFREAFWNVIFDKPSAYEELPFGCIIAVVQLIGMRRTNEAARDISEKEWEFGDYSPGRWAWFTDRAVMLNGAIPFKARQGLFDLPPDIEAQVRSRMK
jgi:hypothetical protein